MQHSTPDFVQSKFDLRDWWVCGLLIAINVALFAWQVLQGMDIGQPSSADALRWGADYAPLTFLLQPWRLISSMFFHFGLIHLMMNMWALYLFGKICEQMLGRRYFLGLYFCAGLFGSLVSGYMAIHDSMQLLNGQFQPALLPSVSAGASGAVMGLGACLTVLSLLPILPQQMFILDKKTLLMVMAINLAFGFMVSGINNAAHIGGMLMGTLLALLWYLGQKYQTARWSNVLALLSGFAICAVFYQYCIQLMQPLLPLWHEILQAMQLG